MKAFISKIMILCLCAAFLQGCQRKGTSFVRLDLKGGENQTVSLYEISAAQGILFLDSIRLDSRGHGRIPFPDDSARLYALTVPGNDGFLFLAPLPGEEIGIQAAYGSMVPTARLQSRLHSKAGTQTGRPSPSQDLLSYLRTTEDGLKAQAAIEEKWNSNHHLTSNRDSLYRSCTMQADSLIASLKQKAEEYCSRNTDNLVPIFVFNKLFGSRPVFDPFQKEDWDFMHSKALEMQKAMPGNPHVRRLLFNLERIESARKNAILQEEKGKRNNETLDTR